MKFRSKKYLAASRDQPCAFCGEEDGTVVAAHYTGMYSKHLGKGVGTKVSDSAVIDACSACHYELDVERTFAESKIFSALIRTIDRRLERLESGELKL